MFVTKKKFEEMVNQRLKEEREKDDIYREFQRLWEEHGKAMSRIVALEQELKNRKSAKCSTGCTVKKTAVPLYG